MTNHFKNKINLTNYENLYLALVFTAATVAGAFAQSVKVAYVDLDYILTSIPEYKSAQEQLDQISRQWQKEIEVKLV